MPRYYRDADEKRAFLKTIFDDTAADYDRVERWLSMGSGKWYRRQALLRAGLKQGMKVADVAVGTGLVAREALAIIGTTGKIVGIDPSPEMMRRAQEGLGIETILGRAESLPFEPGTIDFVSMGYALRHVEDLGIAFREFLRVLRPGARACVLEITRPRTAFGRAFLRGYLGTLSGIIGKVSKLAPRTPELWGYYWETIDQCVPPERVLRALSEAGFTDVKRSISLGIFSEYTGMKPA
jgi:demethylmenaquinone methyltransferase/2-methoxy-6-polyprenyl-1,4-benzoquinol methylase